jgi:Asp-tRNA(Asn)/Glu-tRNA(Gln) amidotransferase A subunit family amidase
MSGIVLRSAVEMRAMLRARKISPLELAEEHIQQIEVLNPQLNALIDFDVDRVLRQAAALDRSVTAPGMLWGLPMSVKASIAVAGHRCETGSLLNQGHTPAADAVVVSRMRQAGAIVLGTSNCPEFLMAYETDNRLYGKTSNPWDLNRTAGGSSGGESAAIAAGLSAGGLGSDGGGSVREPAHFTGICALKPTPGRIPAEGHLPPCLGPFSLLGTVGLMARTIQDVSLFFHALSGQDDTDPAGAPIALEQHSLKDLQQIPIGFFEDDGLTPVTEDTRDAVKSAVRSLQDQGFQVKPFRPRVLEEARQLWWKFFVRAGAMLIDRETTGREAMLSPTLKDFLRIAHLEKPLSGEELLTTWEDCDRIRARFLTEMRQFPVLLMPVCSVPAFRHGEREWNIDGQTVDYLDAMRYTQWFNLLGAPAAVVPVGRSRENLPIGIQVAGRPYQDEIVLAIAGALDRDFGYLPPPLKASERYNLGILENQ